MTQLQEEDPGAAPKLVCSDCNAPWGTFPKCLLCKGSSPIDLSSTPLSVIAVEGQNWQLRLTEAGPTGVLADAKVTKDSGFVEVGDLGRPPLAAVSGAGPEQLDFGFLKTTTYREGGVPDASQIGMFVGMPPCLYAVLNSNCQLQLACLLVCRHAYSI